MRTIRTPTLYKLGGGRIDVNSVKAKQIIEFQQTKHNQCGNLDCINDQYMIYKYAGDAKSILKKLEVGQRLERAEKWKVCKRCRLQLYCCRRCQKIHWKNGHRLICKSESRY